MKKGLQSVLLLSALTVALMWMNAYGQRTLRMELTAESYVEAQGLWQSYQPHLTLPKGEYELLAGGTGPVYVYNGEGTLLGTGDAQEPFSIHLKKDESDIVLYGGQEGSINYLEVVHVRGGAIYRDYFLLSLGLGALVLALGWNRRRSDSAPQSLVFCVLLAVTVLASYPLYANVVGQGHDLNFHLYRIEGIKDGLLEGQFPVRLHPTHNNGYGYITPGVYPELFLYFPAILRLMGASPVMAYNTFLFAVNGMTAWIMYVCAKGVAKSRYAGMLASILYTLSTWRIINLYYRAALGEALAMAFFPVLLYGLYLLLAGEPRKWWVLALGCSGIFQSHMISTIFAAITIAVAAGIYWRALATKERFLGFVKAGTLTLFLNLWYLIPFLTYYLGTDLAIKHTPENTEFYQNAVFPTELFNVFNTSFGYSQLLEHGLRGNMSLSLGVGVTGAMALCAVFFLRGKRGEDDKEKYYGVLTAMGMALLLMSSTLFPWQLLQRVKLINAFCGTVRMPWRFLSLASPMFCLAAAGIMAGRGEQERRLTIWAALGICSLAFIYWGTAYTTGLEPALKQGRAVDSYATAGYDDEYFPWGTDKSRLTPGRYITGGSVGLTGYEKQGTRISLQLQDAHAGDWVEVPLLYYGGYEARDGLGQRLEVVDGDNHVVRVRLREGTSRVELQYQGFWYFRVAEGATLLTLGAWGIWWWRRRGQGALAGRAIRRP
ncbi:MAG: hypothetical protein NC543_00915 [bacterium]|nr:hypothetical protein [bacterium]MCM1375021.1 hypothetical protein [Muribaculum sp.]